MRIYVANIGGKALHGAFNKPPYISWETVCCCYANSFAHSHVNIKNGLIKTELVA